MLKFLYFSIILLAGISAQAQEEIQVPVAEDGFPCYYFSKPETIPTAAEDEKSTSKFNENKVKILKFKSQYQVFVHESCTTEWFAQSANDFINSGQWNFDLGKHNIDNVIYFSTDNLFSARAILSTRSSDYFLDSYSVARGAFHSFEKPTLTEEQVAQVSVIPLDAIFPEMEEAQFFTDILKGYALNQREAIMPLIAPRNLFDHSLMEEQDRRFRETWKKPVPFGTLSGGATIIKKVPNFEVKKYDKDGEILRRFERETPPRHNNLIQIKPRSLTDEEIQEIVEGLRTIQENKELPGTDMLDQE